MFFCVFLGQPPTFATYFRINPETGEVRQIRPIEQLDAKEFSIYVKVNILFVGVTDQLTKGSYTSAVVLYLN